MNDQANIVSTGLDLIYDALERHDHSPASDHELDGVPFVSRSAEETKQLAGPYRLALADLQEQLATCQHLLANNRRKADELVAQAEQLEDQCKPLEEHIDSLQAAIRTLGGAA